MRTLLLILLTLSFSSPASAGVRADGPGVNNGGGGWGCRMDDGSLQWIKTVERFEIERTPDLGRVLQRPADKAEETVDGHLAFLRERAPDLATFLPASTKELLDRVYWRKQALPYVDDADLSWKPEPKSCPGGRVEYLQMAIYLVDGTLLMDETLWNHPKMEEVDRAILLFHEMIYKALRNKRGDRASWPTQFIVQAFFGESDPERRVRAVRNEIDHSKVPGDESSSSNVILFGVDLQCFASSSHGRKSFDSIPGGSDISYDDGAFRYRIVTWDDGRPYILQITDLKTNLSTRLDDFVLFPTFKARQRVWLDLGMEGGNNNAPHGARLLCYNKGSW